MKGGSVQEAKSQEGKGSSFLSSLRCPRDVTLRLEVPHKKESSKQGELGNTAKIPGSKEGQILGVHLLG